MVLEDELRRLQDCIFYKNVQSCKVEVTSNYGESDVTKPSAFESEIHPSHKPSVYALGISLRPSREHQSGNGLKFINGAVISTIHKRMSVKEGGGLWRDIHLFG